MTLDKDDNQLSIGDFVAWPNGRYDRYMQPTGYHHGVILAFNEGVGGTSLRVYDEAYGANFYPHPRHVWKADERP